MLLNSATIIKTALLDIGIDCSKFSKSEFETFLYHHSATIGVVVLDALTMELRDIKSTFQEFMDTELQEYLDESL